MEKSYTLVSGGAGYVGTNVTNLLCSLGDNVIVIDNFSNSKHKYIHKLKEIYKDRITVIEMNLLDKQKLNKVFSSFNISSVIHLAGKKYIPESFEIPTEYDKNNIDATRILLATMTKYNVKKLVFASTITVYGNPNSLVYENTPLCPLSPYAKTKVAGEELINKWSKKPANQSVILRLSNPIGADDIRNLGDDSKKGATGLLPYLINNAMLNKQIILNANIHPTPDGTTVRDYIHVLDVAKAFVLASKKPLPSNSIFNIGSGKNGYSVLDVLKQVEKTTGKKLNFCFGPKREGDASIIVTDNSKALSELKLSISYNLEDMVSSAFNFMAYNKDNINEM